MDLALSFLLLPRVSKLFTEDEEKSRGILLKVER